MPSDLFFILNNIFLLVLSIVSILVSFITVFSVFINPKCRTVSTFLTCNTAVFHAVYSLNALIASFYGFRENWAINQPVCKFRAYSFAFICAIMCFAHAIQAIGRLFVTVLHKHKNLATYRVHGLMVAVSWIISVLLCVPPIFFDGAYVYEKESRLCTLTTQYLLGSIYVVTTIFVFPLSITMIAYGIIVYHARSSPKVSNLAPNVTGFRTVNLKRELKVARRMMIIMTIFAAGGTPYLILVIWNGVKPNYPPPEPCYLLVIDMVSCSVTFMSFELLSSNEDIKETTRRYLKCKYRRVNPNLDKQRSIQRKIRY